MSGPASTTRATSSGGAAASLPLGTRSCGRIWPIPGVQRRIVRVKHRRVLGRRSKLRRGASLHASSAFQRPRGLQRESSPSLPCRVERLKDCGGYVAFFNGLRDALVGISALHESGRLHRDVNADSILRIRGRPHGPRIVLPGNRRWSSGA
ncbi:hypothetical protein BV25DRAFT_376520 [Artomyces pyxidatus]|uniref:Uncharacterized protein n=1 Tax=Artomyces pyxidatus TaxID=48021 RepID=A0ACB8SFL9_9AGAM|nr:hypothetical protein BV25DRAFT_376520 [Artomyces pyxidatus]